MRTAITLGKTRDGWKLISGPEVPADKQRANFNDVGAVWPDGLLELRFQLNDGPAKLRTRQKAEAVAYQTKNAEKRLVEKAAAAKKKEEDDKRAAEAEAAKKKQAEADQRAKELKAKADAKAK